MDKTTKLLILQGVLVTLSIINAGIAAVLHNELVTLLVGAVCAGFSFVVQHLGNQTIPPAPTQVNLELKQSAQRAPVEGDKQ